MTNKQSWGDNWEEEFDKLWGGYPANKYENTKGLDWMVKDFISKLLTSKSEQIEGEKYKNYTDPYKSGFNAGISKCIEMLKK